MGMPGKCKQLHEQNAKSAFACLPMGIQLPPVVNFARVDQYLLKFLVFRPSFEHFLKMRSFARICARFAGICARNAGTPVAKTSLKTMKMIKKQSL